MTFITQIYEIQTPYEAEACMDVGVDHIGSVILSTDSWKQPLIRETIAVSSGSLVKNSIIPLFKDVETLCRLLDYYRPDIIHFCDSIADYSGRLVDLNEYIHYQTEIKLRFPEIKIMRSIPIPVNGIIPGFPTLEIAEQMESISDLFLTDTWLGREPVDGFIGITGKRCDMQMAKTLVKQSKIPVILAGGLSPENVYNALLDIRPAGADSCTLTNKLDKEGKAIRFRKDFVKVRRFADEIKRAEKDVI